MSAYCDTHGLDLPCAECMSERAEELAMLREMERDYEEGRKGEHVNE